MIAQVLFFQQSLSMTWLNPTGLVINIYSFHLTHEYDISLSYHHFIDDRLVQVHIHLEICVLLQI